MSCKSRALSEFKGPILLSFLLLFYFDIHTFSSKLSLFLSTILVLFHNLFSGNFTLLSSELTINAATFQSSVNTLLFVTWVNKTMPTKNIDITLRNISWIKNIINFSEFYILAEHYLSFWQYFLFYYF